MQFHNSPIKPSGKKGYELIPWTDSSCDHNYYAHHHFEKVAEFKCDEWKADNNDYMTYIYKREI